MDVHLRPVAPDDLPVLFAQQADPEAAAMAGFASRDEEGFRAHWARVLADEAVVARVVEVDGLVAGNLVCWADGDQRSVGYWLGKDFWGRGIASAALHRFLREVPERPLWAHVEQGNAGSIRVLEKCGFVATGTGDEGEVLFELA